MSVPRQTISQVFAGLRAQRRIGLMPFVPAGYPNLATTAEILPALERGGASAIEIGIPFSDPIADGPVIQEAFTAALANKLRLADVFAAIREVRPQVAIPMLAMASFSLVYRFGTQKFIEAAKSAGFDGLILPDVVPPDAQGICRQIRSAGLDSVLLVAPTTPPERRRQITDLCSGFVYYVSISGITGERQALPPEIAQNVAALRKTTQLPICVGFGISKAEHVRQLAPVADGAIVGSAVVRRIKERLSDSPAAIAQALSDYCRQLLASD